MSALRAETCGALEKSWQLLDAGGRGARGGMGRRARRRRTGRALRVLPVLVQTRLPEHPVMRALVSGDAEAFAEGECEARRRAGMPPFGRLAALVLSSLPALGGGTAMQRALAEAAPGVAARMPGMESVRVLGPAPAPLSGAAPPAPPPLLVAAHRSGCACRTTSAPGSGGFRAPTLLRAPRRGHRPALVPLRGGAWMGQAGGGRFGGMEAAGADAGGGQGPSGFGGRGSPCRGGLALRLRLARPCRGWPRGGRGCVSGRGGALAGGSGLGLSCRAGAGRGLRLSASLAPRAAAPRRGSSRRSPSGRRNVGRARAPPRALACGKTAARGSSARSPRQPLPSSHGGVAR